ncbi:MAG: hypothetical protein HYX97_06320 [Chloroflexi bacterium]|nr:hypothetical protein [Chloroflexota bacterium]
MAAAKQRAPRRLDRNLRALFITLIAINLLLVILAAAGSGEDPGEAAQQRIASIRRDLNQVQQNLSKATLPTVDDVRGVPTTVITLAQNAGVELNTFSSVLVKASLGTQTFDALSVNVEADGTQQGLLTFLGQASKLEAKSSVVTSLDWRLVERDRWRLKFVLLTYVKG